MELMNFPDDQAMGRKASQLNNKNLFTPRLYEWETLEEYGFTGPLEQLIVPRYSNGFVDDGLRRLFQLNLPVYKPILVEFLASFKLDAYDETDRGLNTKEIIHFRLCGTFFHLSLLDFAFYLGFHDDTLASRQTYLAHLKKASADSPPDFELDDFWEEVGMEPYVGRNCRESHLASPIVRLAHRYLTWTILFSGSPEKVNVAQLKGLHYLLHRENRWHLPLAMAKMFKAAQSDKQKLLPGGHIVTQIAMKTGLFNRAMETLCGPKTWPSLLGKPHLISSMFLKVLPDGNLAMYGIGEKKEDEAGPSTRPKRTRPTPSTRSQAPAYNLQYAINQNNLLGNYMHEVSSLVWQADARAHARYETPLGQPLPPSYGEGWVFPETWEDRMESLNINEEEEE